MGKQQSWSIRPTGEREEWLKSPERIRVFAHTPSTFSCFISLWHAVLTGVIRQDCPPSCINSRDYVGGKTFCPDWHFFLKALQEVNDIYSSTDECLSNKHVSKHLNVAPDTSLSQVNCEWNWSIDRKETALLISYSSPLTIKLCRLKTTASCQNYRLFYILTDTHLLICEKSNIVQMIFRRIYCIFSNTEEPKAGGDWSLLINESLWKHFVFWPIRFKVFL